MEFLAELLSFVSKAVVIAAVDWCIASAARSQQGKEGGLRVIDWESALEDVSCSAPVRSSC